ncbi:ROK family transcriptional regulator [Aestuariivirga sp.]|uniref:ROK family transcriptional regulator n=1 Tax=Aestuariivirga sp. TaxID=2650926 RepID=UPI0039E2407F
MALKGTNQEFGRPYNRRIVLEAIRMHGPIERGEIARRVGLTVQTVANIIRELEEQGFITAARAEPKGRGSPATRVAINSGGGHAIGIHVTPLGLEAALVDLGGTILARAASKLPHPEPRQAFADIRRLVKQLKPKPDARLLGVGLAMPGPFDVDSMSFVGPTTLEGWKGFPVEQKLAEITGLPAFVEIDHAAAALGERLYGAGKPFRDFYYLYFGVGLGGCMVYEGLPWRGSHRNAGEIGHVPLVPEGEPCACGNRGCLERYLSLEAFERRSAVIGREGWIAEAAPLLRSAVAAVENLFDPETILFGGLADEQLMDDLIARAMPLGNSVSQRSNRETPRLIRAAGGQDAVLRGAAALAIAGVLSPRFGLLFTQTDHKPSVDPLFTARNVA